MKTTSKVKPRGAAKRNLFAELGEGIAAPSGTRKPRCSSIQSSNIRIRSSGSLPSDRAGRRRYE